MICFYLASTGRLLASCVTWAEVLALDVPIATVSVRESTIRVRSSTAYLAAVNTYRLASARAAMHQL